MDKLLKTPLKIERRNKESCEKCPPIVAIPLVVRPTIVGIQPRVVRIPIDIEHVRVAIAVKNLYT
jgi:hypothetical protein